MNVWLVLQLLAAAPGLLILAADQRRWRAAEAGATRSLLRWRQVGTAWLIVGLPAAFIAVGSAARAMGAVAVGLMAQTGFVPEPTFATTPTALEQFMGALSILVPLGASAVAWSSWRMYARVPRNFMVPDVDAVSVTGRAPRRPDRRAV